MYTQEIDTKQIVGDECVLKNLVVINLLGMEGVRTVLLDLLAFVNGIVLNMGPCIKQNGISI